MAKFIRYAIAVVCFAASVGCLALWWRSDLFRYYFQVVGAAKTTTLEASSGYLFATTLSNGMAARGYAPQGLAWSKPQTQHTDQYAKSTIDHFGMFYADPMRLHLPLWYPALVFALAGVGVLRFRRRFSIRGALTAMSVIAALLGMVVAL